MNQPRNLMACTDFSQPALLAISRALALAETLQGRCTVTHVLPSNWLSDLQNLLGLDPVSSQQKAIEIQTHELNSLVSTLLQGRALNVLTQLLLGQPAEQITRQAERDRTDLIVMGTHGSGHVGHLLTGSTTLAVIHDSPCPVLVVRSPQQLPYGKILLAIDLTPASLHLVQTAQAMSGDAKFVLMHVLHSAFDEITELGLLDPAERERCQEAVIVDTYARLGMLALRAGLSRAQFQIEILPSISAQALIEHAHEHQYDLIVTAKQSSHRMRDHLTGSFTQTILAQALCDVLVVPPAPEFSAQVNA